MATRDTFTTEEWHDLQWALMLAGSHVTGSDWPGWRKSFKEAAGGSRCALLLGVARVMADEVDGTSAQESEALARIEQALA